MADDLSLDMSDLDKQLFGNNFSSKDSKIAKKNVTFNEEENDILDSLLNDDIFPNKESVLGAKNTKVTELFGIKPSSLSDPSKLQEQKKSLTDKTTKISSDNQRQDIIKSIMIDNNDSKIRAKSPLENIETKRSNFKNDFQMSASTREQIETNTSYKSNIGDTNISKSEYTPTTRIEPRRRRRANSIVLDDPLQLFSDSHKRSFQTEQTYTDQEAKTSTITSELEKPKQETYSSPEWLLGGSNQIPKRSISSEEKKYPTSIVETSKRDNEIKPEFAFLSNIQNNQISLLASMQDDIKSTVSLFQQYEQLNNVLMNQKMKLIEQEKQFGELVKKQIEGQVLLDGQLKMQQGCINNCLKTLTGKAMSNYTNLKDNMNSNNEFTGLDKKSEAEILLKTLRVEKTELEKTLEIVKERHNNEIDIINESYRKQIQYLEELLERKENRSKKDSETLEENYEIKIQQMKDKIFELEKTHSEEKEQMRIECSKLLQKTYETHLHNMELLQKEHADIVENISKSKKLEQNAIELVTTNGTDIVQMLDNSKTAINTLIELQNRIDERDEIFIVNRENAFKKQQIQLESLKEQLNQEKEALEIDRKKLIETAQQFKSDMSLILSEFRNRMNQLMDMENNIKLRESAIIKDRELLMEQSKWERAQIQASKEMWDKQHMRQAKELAKEQENITVERKKLEIFRKLNIESDEVDKVEFESSIQAAKEATESVVRERKLWQERIAELESQRKMLLEKESHLVQQAKHLEDLTQLAIVKKNEGIAALKKARRMEQIYKEKFQQLQVQLQVLDERENNIAAEKISLARHRINLRMYDVEMPEKDEIPIKNHNNEILNKNSFVDESVKLPIQTYFKDIVDPKLLLLKINLNNKLTE